MNAKRAQKRLDAIFRSLSRTHNDREFLLKRTRDVILWSGRSIVAVHGGQTQQARSALEKAGRHLKGCRAKSDSSLARYLVPCEQEFAEASVLLAIVNRREIPTDTSLGISAESYILGLLDTVGELKRLVLDRIRQDRMDDALEAFGIMEDLFAALYPFAGMDKVVKDARRKLDVNRMLIEDTRSVITQETRRQEILEAFKHNVQHT